MFVQTENTPNPNSLKFFPGKKVSNDDPLEITDKNESKNDPFRTSSSLVQDGYILPDLIQKSKYIIQ